nr:type II toxin-antitoxin system CcdA family antitoxin [Musicola keenii]
MGVSTIEKRHPRRAAWQEENREAIDALNHFPDEQDCFSDEYRTF